jgi:hypothetical protein
MVQNNKGWKIKKIKKLGVMETTLVDHVWNKGGWTWNVIKLV